MNSVAFNNGLVNKPVPDLDVQIRSDAAYQALRQRWTSFPRIPKLVDRAACPVVAGFGGQTILLALKLLAEKASPEAVARFRANHDLI